MYWPNMQRDIQNFINPCETCLQNKYERNPIQIPNILTPTANKPLEKIHIDLLSVEKTKFLTIVDSFSKHAQAYEVKNQNAITIVNKLMKYFSHYGIPHEITADNGREFNNKILINYLNFRKININFTSVDNPKSNGIIERFHSTLIEHLRILNQNKTFKELRLKERVNYALIAYNNSIHSVTKETPLNILLGHLKLNNFQLTEETIVDSYIQNHKEIMEEIYCGIKRNIEKSKLKYSEEVNKEIDLPGQVYLKQHKRNVGKCEKPKFKIISVEDVTPQRCQITDDKGKKHKYYNVLLFKITNFYLNENLPKYISVTIKIKLIKLRVFGLSLPIEYLFLGFLSETVEENRSKVLAHEPSK